MASPFPFTSGQVLTAAQLNSIGEATAFTPSWTNLTPGNATETWYYTQVNELVLVQGITVLGSTSSITGTVYLAPPVGSLLVTNPMAGELYCVGTDLRVGMVQLTPSGLSPQVFTVDGSYINRATVDATEPFTWASGNSLRMSVIYQLA